MKDVSEQLKAIKSGVTNLVTEEELLAKLKRGKPLIVKLGIDVTAPDIHLGHTIVLRKLRQFQNLGHHALLIIGDFTTLIGDPSGRNKMRPPLSPQEIEKNAKTYFQQVEKVLDLKNLEIRRNSEWLGIITLRQLLELSAKLTVSQIFERDDFTNRRKAGEPIGFHELHYPLLQAYDSVAIKADIELGGSDQLFNLLVGRDLQRALGQEAQIAITTPLLVGIGGGDKMSKSLGNHIGVTEPAYEMYSKVMSIPDNLMKEYFALLTDLESADVGKLLNGHPMEAKKRLALEVALCYHKKEEAQKAAQEWDKVMSKKEMPENIAELPVITDRGKDGKVWIVNILRQTRIPASNSDARRLIEQGGVELDGKKITDPKLELEPRDGSILKVGKKNRYFKLVVK